MNPDTTALLQVKSIQDLKKTKFSYERRIENERRFWCQLERTEAGEEKVNALAPQYRRNPNQDIRNRFEVPT